MRVRSVCAWWDWIREGLRSIDSLEFRKHESFTMAIIHHFIVSALAETALLLHLHRLFLVFITKLGIVRGEPTVAFLRGWGLFLKGKGVDHLLVRDGSA